MSAWGVDPHIITPALCQCRLSLSSSEVTPTADQTAKTSIYCHPYRGNQIALFDGSYWRRYSLSSFISVSVPATTATPFDLFLYYSGGLQLEAVSWSSDTARSVALTTQDGVLVKSGATARRYLGSGRTTASSGECEDSVTKRFLWNQYHRRRLTLKKFVTGTASWNYSTAAYRAYNNDSAERVELVCGVAGEAVLQLTAIGESSSSNDDFRAIGIGQSSTTVNACDAEAGHSGTVQPTITRAFMHAQMQLLHPARYHYYSPLENGGGGGGTTTWYGDPGDGTPKLAGIHGTWEA